MLTVTDSAIGLILPPLMSSFKLSSSFSSLCLQQPPHFSGT